MGSLFPPNPHQNYLSSYGILPAIFCNAGCMVCWPGFGRNPSGILLQRSIVILIRILKGHTEYSSLQMRHSLIFILYCLLLITHWNWWIRWNQITLYQVWIDLNRQVEDVNDKPPQFTKQLFVHHVAEVTPVGTQVRASRIPGILWDSWPCHTFYVPSFRF